MKDLDEETAKRWIFRKIAAETELPKPEPEAILPKPIEKAEVVEEKEVEAQEEKKEVPLHEMTKAELADLAVKRNLPVTPRMNKAEIVELLIGG